MSIEVYTGGSDNPGSFVPFFASLPTMNENQRSTTVGENAQSGGGIVRCVLQWSTISCRGLYLNYLKKISQT